MAPTPLTSANPIDKQFEKVTRYHLYFFSLYFISKLPSVWHTLNIIFLSPPMTYTCGKTVLRTHQRRIPVPLKEEICPCDNPIWDYSVFTKTVQTKYGIICERRWLNSFSESMSFFGLLVGAMVFGVMADRYGRLMMYAFCQLITGSAGCLVTVMPNIYLFIIMRFFEGVGTGGSIVTGYVLCMEYCGPNYRATISAILHLPTNLGLILLAGISYLIRDCDHFQLAVSIPVLVFVAVKCLLLESPKWLLENHHEEKAIKAMEKFCRFNKQPCPEIRSEIEAYNTSRTVSNVQRMKFYHIFKYRRHSINFCCMAYLYFVCGMCYYGVSQFIGKMSTQVHRNTVFNAMFLCMGTLFSTLIINRVGRRSFLRTTMFFAGAFMLAVVSLPLSFEPAWIKVMFACFSSAFFYMCFNIIFLYGVELFPTNIRNSALGFLSLMSRVGQILGPQVNSFSTSIAGTVFGILAVIAFFVTFCLPETRGTQLPTTLEDSPEQNREGNVKLTDQPRTAVKTT